MAICHHCSRRRAKRHCPALRAELCQLCCGELRQKKLTCPPSCPFLKHQIYQDERRWQKTKRQPKKALGDEKLMWLAAQVEATIFQLAEQNKDFSDREAVRSLEYARDKIASGNKRIIIPGERTEIKFSPGEIILQVIDKARYETGLVLSPSSTAFSREDKLACLETLLGLVYEITTGDLSGRIYLKNLAHRINKAQKEKASQKIILP